MYTPFYLKIEHSNKDKLFQKIIEGETNKIRDNSLRMDNFRDESVINNIDFKKQIKMVDSNFARPLIPTFMPFNFFYNTEHHEIEKDNEIRVSNE